MKRCLFFVALLMLSCSAFPARLGDLTRSSEIVTPVTVSASIPEDLTITFPAPLSRTVTVQRDRLFDGELNDFNGSPRWIGSDAEFDFDVYKNPVGHEDGPVWIVYAGSKADFNTIYYYYLGPDVPGYSDLTHPIHPVTSSLWSESAVGGGTTVALTVAPDWAETTIDGNLVAAAYLKGDGSQIYGLLKSWSLHKALADLDMDGHSILNVSVNSIEFTDGTVLSAGTVANAIDTAQTVDAVEYDVSSLINLDTSYITALGQTLPYASQKRWFASVPQGNPEDYLPNIFYELGFAGVGHGSNWWFDVSSDGSPIYSYVNTNSPLSLIPPEVGWESFLGGDPEVSVDFFINSSVRTWSGYRPTSDVSMGNWEHRYSILNGATGAFDVVTADAFGGDGIVQEAGTATDKVMSQDAISTNLASKMSVSDYASGAGNSSQQKVDYAMFADATDYASAAGTAPYAESAGSLIQDTITYYGADMVQKSSIVQTITGDSTTQIPSVNAIRTNSIDAEMSVSGSYTKVPTSGAVVDYVTNKIDVVVFRVSGTNITWSVNGTGTVFKFTTTAQ